MRRIASLSTIVIIALILGAHLGAEQGAGHNHIGHVMDAWNDTPDGVGLLPAAVEEAGVAAQHASLAAKDPSNLDAMKRHAAHVLHAVDPSQIENGPGKGYGVKQGAEGAAKHIQAAANTDGASDAIKTHATHVATSALHVLTRLWLLPRKSPWPTQHQLRQVWWPNSTRWHSSYCQEPMPTETAELAGKKVKVGLKSLQRTQIS